MQLPCPSFKSNRSKFYEFWISSRCSLSKGLRWKGWKEWFYLRKKQINDIDMKIYRKQWKRFIFKMPYSECRTNKHGLYLYIFSFHPYKAFLWFYICVLHWFQDEILDSAKNEFVQKFVRKYNYRSGHTSWPPWY